MICSYHPETLTVRAGLNLPTGRGQVHVPAAEKFEGGDNYLRKGRNMRTGKMLQKPEALGKLFTFPLASHSSFS